MPHVFLSLAVRMVVVLLATLAAGPLRAQGPQAAPRVDVVFQITQSTTVGQSVFVLGDLPELGANDIRKAVKLAPTSYPVWRATINLPAGRAYSYRFYLRNDAPGQGGNAANGTPLGNSISAATPAQPAVIASKTIFFTTDRLSPRVWWRQPSAGQTTFTATPMTRWETGRVRGDGVAETRWMAWNLGTSGREIEFYFTDASGGSRTPPTGQYRTSMEAVFVQDGELYSYIPAAAVSQPARNYSPASPPALFSTNLNESKVYRVWLPRGYAQHTARRYPVLYMHDGQNVFESGSFGSWNAATALTTQTRAGAMREIIVVAVDNGPNRLTDYLPPGDTLTGAGRADRYARFLTQELKPLIDAQFRTLPDRALTGAAGSSMGGVVSLYLGWDFTTTFGRVGLFSGAWWSCPNFRARIAPASQVRDLRIYMDSGDSGTSNDDYWNTYNLRDSFIGPATPRSVVERTLRHVVGYGQQHNEAAWSARLPAALTFLYPAEEEPSDLLRTQFGPQLDLTGDGAVETEDLYAQHAEPRDLNLDGTINSDDTSYLERVLRRGELDDMTAGRR